MKRRINKIYFTLVFLVYAIVPMRAQEIFEDDDVHDAPIDDYLPLLFLVALVLGYFFLKNNFVATKK